MVVLGDLTVLTATNSLRVLTLLLTASLLALGPSLALAQAGKVSEQCRAFRADLDADVGEIMRAGCEPTLEQMSRLMDNPLGNVAMWWNQFDWYRMRNDEETGIRKNQTNYMGIFQFPKRLNDDWNLINRVVYNVPSIPLDQDKIDDFGFPPTFQPPGGGGPSQPPSDGTFLPVKQFSGRTTGFGDMYYVGLFSPAEPIRHESGAKSVWGLGADLSAPTASEDILGTGKWSAGPSAIYVYLGEKWKVGGLYQHYTSFAGSSSRDRVNLTNFQYFYFYSLTDTISIGAAPNIISNWEADRTGDRYTVPVGLGVARTFQFGKLPVRIGTEFHYNVVRPDTVGGDWTFRFYMIPAMPSALFKWMQ